ncbi:uncharacterized protein LOC117162306 isoform X2 [Bombus vancouverensis nearcticus]|uniref:uncharacterized protein LOC117162306 isoform X2 n=1 Tax=Bombus vancouverensis nearcticus TaxID=2705178 RepID=UPI00402B190D
MLESSCCGKLSSVIHEMADHLSTTTCIEVMWILNVPSSTKFHQVQSSIKELFTLSDCIGEISRSQRFFCMVFKSILCILQFFIATLAFTGRFFIYLFMV